MFTFYPFSVLRAYAFAFPGVTICLLTVPLAAAAPVFQSPRGPIETLGPSSRKTGLVISELMVKPADRADGKSLEFIELHNSTPFQVDLSNYQLAGDAEFTFAPGTTLPAGGFLVVGKAPHDILALSTATNVVGPYRGSLKTSGTVRLLSERGAILLEINYSNNPPWPAGADGTGHSLVLARPSYGEGEARAWELGDEVGGSPGRAEVAHATPLRSVLINEILARTDPPLEDFIELYNHSNETVDISGCSLSDDPQVDRFVIPPGSTLAPRGFRAFFQTELGFGLDGTGETIYLKNPARTQVLDAVRFRAQASNVSTGRSPEGGEEWYPMQAPTPHLGNGAIRISDVVINEILYAPVSGNDREQFVEVYNAAVASVDLTGWRFTAGIDFIFPPGAVLPPGQYAVVAKDPDYLRTVYPQLTGSNTFGPFGGRLSRGGERLALARPNVSVTTDRSGVTVTNVADVVVDEVSWRGGGRWGQWAHGGGSSLELIDSLANHRLAGNWADSDETARAPWTTIEATAVLDYGEGYNNGPILNVEVMLLGEGECLLDDVEVFETPAGANLVPNPDFESGLDGWVVMGNHVRSSLETQGGYASGQSLHIRASSRGDTGANRIRAELSTSPTPGQTVTIRAKARWLAGWPELLLRLHGNYMEATGVLPLAASPGTPGARNSRAKANAPPAFRGVTPYPAVPAAGEAVVVTAGVEDSDGVHAVTLQYRIDPGTDVTSLKMVDDGSGPDAVAGDGIFSGEIPGQPAGTLVAFFLRAEDAFGESANFPKDAPGRECLVRFGDPQPNTRFGIYRQWFTKAAIDTWAGRPALSNERLDGTFVYGNSRVIYNFGSRYAGSPYHQRFASPLNDGHYSIEFPLDDLLLGTDNFNKVHAPGNGPFDDATIQREQTCFWFVRQLGLPWLYRRYVAMYINGQRRGTLMEDTQTPGSDVIEEYFPEDPDGYLFKLQPWFEFGNSTGRSLPFSNNAWCSLNRFLTTGGVHKLARYRWNYLGRAVQSTANDYRPVFELVDAANAVGAEAQAAAFEQVADAEQWMRTFAVEHAVGNWDSFGAQNEQNMYGYKPDLGKWNLFVWDYNIVLGNSGSWGPGQNLFAVNSGDGPMQRLLANPPFRRAMWRAYKELCLGPMQAENVNPMMDEKFAVFRDEGLNVSSPAGVQAWIASARESILSQLERVDAPSFTVTTPGSFTIDASPATLTGEAPVEVKSIRVNNVEYPVTWSTVTTWKVQVPVREPSNVLQIQGYDLRGNSITTAVATVTVQYTGPLNSGLTVAIRATSEVSGARRWQLEWPSETGQRYQVELKTDLQQRDWTKVGEVLTATDLLTSIDLDLATDARRFYRVVRLP